MALLKLYLGLVSQIALIVLVSSVHFGCSGSIQDIEAMVAEADPPPQLVGASSLAFGDVEVGEQYRRDYSVTVTVAATTFQKTVIKSEDSAFSLAATDCPDASVVDLGSTCNTSIMFSPKVPGTYKDYLLITYSLPDGSTLVAELALTGVGKKAAEKEVLVEEELVMTNATISASPPIHDFGMLPTYTSAAITITMTNSSTADLALGSFSGLGTTFSQQSTTCTDLLPAKSDCAVVVKFLPGGGGGFSTNLVLPYNLKGSEQLDFLAMVALQGSAGINPPTNITLGNITGSSVTLAWDDNSTDETGFQVEYCAGIACSANFVKTAGAEVGKNITNHNFTGLTAGEYHAFRVRSLNTGGTSSWLTSSQVLFFSAAALSDNGSGDSDISAFECDDANLAKTYVKLSWANTANASAYRIYKVAGANRTLLSTEAAGSSSAMVPGLDTAADYKFLVKAVGTAGGESVNQVTTDVTTSNFVYCNVIGGESTVANLGDVLDGPTDITSYNNKLIVSDERLHRVLIWNSIPTSTGQKADLVVGQRALNKRQYEAELGSPQAMNLQNPRGVWAGLIGGEEKLLIADYSNHRVLVFDGIPTSNFASASVVIGQSLFTTSASGCTQTGLKNPWDVWSDGTKVYISDRENHRILIYNSLPTANGASADVVVGQSSFTSCSSGNTATTLKKPKGIWSDGTNLLIADYDNHRVLLYDSVPTSNGAAASTAIGQTSLTANSWGRTDVGLRNPTSVLYEGGKLFISDLSNHRLLIYNSGLPSAGSHGPSADVAIGRTTGNSNGGSNPTPTAVHSPEGFAVVSGKIFLADYNNDRVVVHNSLPTADGRSHDIVLGQPHLETELWASATSFSYPRGVASDGTALFVSDYNNNRVLVYSSIPSTANASADFVLGQADFISSVASTSQTALRNPRGLCVVGGKLYVVDYSAHRVLRYGLPITADNPNAEAVLGQENWTSRGSGNSNSAFDRPISCASDGTRFYVSMEGKDKVHMWNSIPVMSDETDNPSADVIIGTGSEGNASNQIRNPRGIFATTSSLIVADYQNHRVNIYNPLPTSDQPDLAYYLGVAAGRNTINSLRYPSDFALSPSGRAYVLDGQNSRVMVFEGLTGAYSPAAVAVMGQENFETGTENPSLTKWSLGNNSEGMIYHKGRLIIADTDNRRVVIVPAK